MERTNAANAERDAAKAERDAAKEKLEEVQAELERVKAANASLEKGKAALDATSTESKAKLEEVKAELERVKAELVKSQGEVEALNSKEKKYAEKLTRMCARYKDVLQTAQVRIGISQEKSKELALLFDDITLPASANDPATPEDTDDL